MVKGAWLSLVLGLSVLFAGRAQASDSALPRVASASLCADQYILELADPTQITSLSKSAQGPLSSQADKAKNHEINRGALEEFLAMDTHLVILDTHDAPQLRKVLPQFGIEVYELPYLNRFEDVLDQIRKVGALLKQGAKAEALVKSLQNRLDALTVEADDDRPLISYFRPDGGGAGSGTFVDEVLRMAGYENLQVKLGYDGWRGIPMEELVLVPPPGGVTSFFDTTPPSARQRFGTHPIYQKLSQEEALFAVAGKHWPCSGPMLVDAAEILAQARQTGFPQAKRP